ncbi:MAG TPA: hypothetical protein P5056_00055 [Candidatus Paceibacterota bacterium]|nr:hypothetical protein [Candidatus Paceibacterota bacterium]
MKRLTQKRRMVFLGIGLYMIIAPMYMGIPTATENAIYVLLGAVLLWLSLESEKTTGN